MRNLRKTWMQFIDKSIIYQMIFFSILMIISTLFFILLSGLISTSFKINLVDVFSQGYTNIVVLDVNDIRDELKNESPLLLHSLIALGLLHKSILVFLIAIWQAVLIFKMLLTKPEIELSRIMCYYNLDCRLSEQDHNSLVFRLVNFGHEDVFKVKITAQLRVLIEESPGSQTTKTFRHYNLSVTSPDIPVLEPNMPYLIFIKTGLVENVGRKAYLITGSDNKEIAEGKLMLEVLNFNNQGSPKYIDLQLKDNQAQIIVLVEVFDDLLDQNDITKKTWNLNDRENIKLARFKSIEPDNNHSFDPTEVARDMHLTA